MYFCHGLHWPNEPRGSGRFFEMLERWALRNTHAVIVSNASDKDWFEAKGADIPLLFLSTGVGLDSRKFQPVEPLPRSAALKMAWMGSMTRRKRPEDALEVQRLLGDLGIPSTLHMAGRGPLENKIKARIDQIPGSSWVEFVSSNHLLGGTHMLLHTAAWEGLSRSILEANAIGRPCFGYNVKGVRDAPWALTRGKAGDVGDLAALIREWWCKEPARPNFSPVALDWRRSHGEVTTLLREMLD